MSPWLFPVGLAVVALIITMVSRAHREWKAAAGGLVLLAMVADSVIAGLRALLQ